MLKYCALFSLCAGVSLAADFLTGQAARLVIGQTTFTQQLAGTANTLLGGVGGVAYANNTLFVADANRIGLTPINNRVLIYNNVSSNFAGPNDQFDPTKGVRCPVCGGQANVVVGQPDFISSNPGLTQKGMNNPTAVASDGTHLAVADTSNNRVLIWNTIPTQMDQPADVVVGQKDFTSLKTVVPDATSVRAPQGVWLDGGKLYVADTLNNRIMIWNTVPTQNNQAADLELGQANFTTVTPVLLTDPTLGAQQNTILNPSSVTTDGVHLFVTDLGHNRVMIWQKIPTTNNAPADVEIGQKDFVSAVAGDVAGLAIISTGGKTCASNGSDSTGAPIYPFACEKSLNFPRFALSDGTRLFVADGGDDRILIFNTIPTVNATSADEVLGQIDFVSSKITSAEDLFTPNLDRSASNATATPTALAWDGTNLYATDPTSRRILVFTPRDNNIAINGIRNAASIEIFAFGTFTLSVTAIKADDQITLTINNANYVYKEVATDSVDTIVQALTNLINAGDGDPNVIATAQLGTGVIGLKARASGAIGNNITISATVSTNAQVTATASGTTLLGGEDATTLAPGTFVAIFGQNLADNPVSAPPNASPLPRDLGGVQVYFDGIRSPVTFVSPTQINAQIPFELTDSDGTVSNSVSGYVRTQHADGSVTTTTAIGVPVAPQNPGIYTVQSDADTRPALAYHSSSYATGTIVLNGTVSAGDVLTIMIEDRLYGYTSQSTDSLADVRDAFVGLINANPNERVVATAGASSATNIRLRAKVAGPEGDGIPFSASVSTNATTTLGPTNTMLCCANIAGAPLTADNPALPGETFYIFATGLGFVMPQEANLATVTGAPYFGPVLNDPNEFVSSLADGFTANVISAGLQVGAIGVYQVFLELNTGVPANSAAPLTIAQNIYVSNTVLIPIGNPTATSPLMPSAAPAQTEAVSRKDQVHSR
jgi:uncharacterized protein (TIGR03437 family)